VITDKTAKLKASSLTPALHALFISALPKLPAICIQLLPLLRPTATIYISINDLAVQPSDPVWHPTCTVRVWRQRILAAGVQGTA